MKLWLISQSENKGYDTFDSAVVAAETEEAAQKIHPGGPRAWENHYAGWVKKPESVSAKQIGEALPGTEAGVICASFNAG